MTQPLIKIFLLAAIAVVGLFALRGSTRAMHRVLWRGYVVLILVAAALGVLFPGSTTWIAHKVGVGRGADLLLYVLVVTFMFVSVILFRRLAALERKYVVLSRAVAIQEARSESPGADREDPTSAEPGNASS